MRIKYVIMNLMDKELPFIFPECINHDEFACTQGGKKNVVSAGFCNLDNDNEWIAWGESYSLKVKSRPEDSDILNCYLNC